MHVDSGTVDRSYANSLIKNPFKWNMMLFLMGARQVGKTTVAKLIAESYKKVAYFNWDIDTHRRQIISGQEFIENILKTNSIEKPIVIFDEIHKYPNWKNYMKGFYDLYKDSYHIIVTGSAHLNVFQKGGDSLMGRYIPYTIHPFSIGELNTNPIQSLYRERQKIPDEEFEALYHFGGFPAPFLNREEEGYLQWKRARMSQLFREDIRDTTRIQEVSKLELCAIFLEHQSGNILNRSTIANQIRVTVPTIGKWIETLKQFYYLFTIQPWTTNIPHSLIKEPKIYVSDWSLVSDPGARFETFVACHLKKSVDFWCESGKGEFELFFLRDKRQQEVDFLITKDQIPWILVEVKTSEQSVTKSLHYYKEITKAPYAFQVTKDMDYIDYDCFSKEGTFIVPAKTFLSQLV
jgi:uncharacterized protein